MQYPLYVQRRDGRGYRGRFADFPWLEVDGETFGALTQDAARLVQRVYHRSEHVIPAPTIDTSKLKTLEMDDGQGLWMFVDVDLTAVQSHSVFVQVCLRKRLLQEIDLAAQKRHLSRSAYIALACVHELAHVCDEGARQRS
ncbi:type II toxin-antitoxin system HicB family antitoxin [Paraburkholderia tropica]|uniref:type II toxin-antitoxin system HicB family antitoxin n=1 Tax=Paraburkholderia tropica TaxID=92647 RepID=UPI001F39F749|nr:type II toxin-antitoxin system HicB family antitoxin [Paraburkholderia tropica]